MYRDTYQSLENLFVDVAQLILDNYGVSIDDLHDILKDRLELID